MDAIRRAQPVSCQSLTGKTSRRATREHWRKLMSTKWRYSRRLRSCPRYIAAHFPPGHRCSSQYHYQYFRAWASAASVHDNERAVKRLQTRQRFVNLSEEKMAQKQQHCKFLPSLASFCFSWLTIPDEEVVKAFESALALLRSHA